jgi:HTH-type transcriptional regulator, cell division transcriptional repressor
MTIGPRVRERRLALGLSQDRLAHEAGLTWSAVQKLETGKIVDPHYSTLEALSHALGTTVAELVGEQEASRVPLGV